MSEITPEERAIWASVATTRINAVIGTVGMEETDLIQTDLNGENSHARTETVAAFVTMSALLE